jgi:hypothetical protein
VLLVGSIGYHANAQAADSPVQEIWSAVRARVPAARLVVIGPGRATLEQSWPKPACACFATRTPPRSSEGQKAPGTNERGAVVDQLAGIFRASCDDNLHHRLHR